MIMATGRFRSPKTEKEEIALLSETVPKNTKYNTKWAVNVFTAWQTRNAGGGNGLESTNSVFKNCTINFVVKK